MCSNVMVQYCPLHSVLAILSAIGLCKEELAFKMDPSYEPYHWDSYKTMEMSLGQLNEGSPELQIRGGIKIIFLIPEWKHVVTPH